MNNVVPKLLKVYNGPPDLTVNIMLSTSQIWGVNQFPGPQNSSLITVVVHNRLSVLPKSTLPDDPNTLPAFGSDAKGVMVRIGLSSGLRQTGGVGLPAGFQAAVAPNNQTVLCFGGDIAAGSSVNFVIEVIGVSGAYETITAEVDPFSVIPETSETNNTAIASIFVIFLN